MAMFLVKTEPGTYSFDDLMKEGTTAWTGVSNNAALLALRAMRKGDDVLVYHSGDEKTVVGLAKVARAAYEDPDRPGRTPEGLPKFAVVDLKAGRRVPTSLTLAQIKSDPRFREFSLVKQSRLSVMDVPADLVEHLLLLVGL